MNIIKDVIGMGRGEESTRRCASGCIGFRRDEMERQEDQSHYSHNLHRENLLGFEIFGLKLGVCSETERSNDVNSGAEGASHVAAVYESIDNITNLTIVFPRETQERAKSSKRLEFEDESPASLPLKNRDSPQYRNHCFGLEAVPNSTLTPPDFHAIHSLS
jgi:hypothetical protein